MTAELCSDGVYIAFRNGSLIDYVNSLSDHFGLEARPSKGSAVLWCGRIEQPRFRPTR